MMGILRMVSLFVLYPQQKKVVPVHGVSVVVCTRNNLEALKENIKTVLEQDYENYELVVVDDASNDQTIDYLQQLQSSYSNLRIIRIEQKKHPGKKFALMKGIEAAEYPTIIVTDADCKPVSTAWIKSHASLINADNIVVLGYGPYAKRKGFLNLLIRIDTSKIAIHYLNKGLWKYPYMGVGRNMAYSKALADSLKDVDQTLASGDDDLFVQAISNQAKFVVNLEKESFTCSTPPQSWSEWMNQKARHTTTAPHYGFFTKAGLILQWILSVGFYLGILAILLTGDTQTGLILFGLNFLCMVGFNGLWLNKLGEKDIILLTPILDFIYIFVQPIFVIKSWGRKKERWN